MESVERIEHRARIRYELARMRRALFGFAPALVIVALTLVFAKRPFATLEFGVLMFALGIVFLWYGRDLKRAVLPGLAAGIVPLALTLCANHVGHVCMGDQCMTLCLPACATGGAVAGVVTAILGVRRRAGVGYFIAASSVALLTGAMGCGCVGYSGLVGLAIGFGAGLVPGFVGKLFRPPPV